MTNFYRVWARYRYVDLGGPRFVKLTVTRSNIWSYGPIDIACPLANLLLQVLP